MRGGSYRAVRWNRHKNYDRILGLTVLLYIATYLVVGSVAHPGGTLETLLIRAFSGCALLLLHLILAIGPLCRLDRRFLPLLAGRRHLEVTMFLLALAHGAFAIFQFHGFGDTNPIVSLLTSNGRIDSVAQFPFQPLGFSALLILFLVASTRHDFWRNNLRPGVWKTLHTAVYIAYGLVIAHVALGTMQAEPGLVPPLAIVLGGGAIGLFSLHLAAAWRAGHDPADTDPGAEAVHSVGDLDAKQRRFLQRLVPVLVLAAVAVATVGGLQQHVEPGVFEFGVVTELEGVVREHPYPALRMSRPQAGAAGPSYSSYHLVALGKFGAEDEVAGLDGQQVRLQGSLVYRDDQAMIEVVAGSVETLEGVRPTEEPSEDLGVHTLRGEILDSKCHLGVMKPGRGKPHKACAIRCISGGIPPLFIAETEDGERRYFLLVDEDGDRVNQRVLDKVAEPVEITGRVRRLGDQLVLAADPVSYRRL